MKILIVGGAAGGATAAVRLRRLDENCEIILLEKGEFVSYASCGLPYYIGEVIKNERELTIQTPGRLKDRFNIDVRVNNEAKRVYPDKKIIEIYNYIENKTYVESYDKLILSTGANPLEPNIQGIESDNIFTLRDIPDTLKIKEFVDNQKAENAVIVGAGFIGLEIAENLILRGVKVTVVELSDHVLGAIDFEMAAIVYQHLKFKGVNLYLKDGVESFEKIDKKIKVNLTSKKNINADMVLIGIGVKPNTKLAVEAGIKIGQKGGILVNEYMETSEPDIYALGDAVEVKDYVSGQNSLIPLAGPANKQGRIAANNIFGIKDKYDGTQGTSIVKIFDITAATTGNNERLLKRNNIDYEKSFTHSSSHAGYYPGSMPISIKLLFKKDTGKILGAQMIGYEGVDKRIDVISTAMRAGMTVFDLQELELAYAPPYSSAKDPVNIAGYVAANILKGDMEVFYWNDIVDIDKNNSVLLDVREPMEYSLGTIEGAINIPVNQIRTRMNEIPKDKEIYVFCQIGLRGYIAYRILKQNGFKVKNLSGGYMTYEFAVKPHLDEEAYDNVEVLRDNMIKPVE